MATGGVATFWIHVAGMARGTPVVLDVLMATICISGLIYAANSYARRGKEGRVSATSIFTLAFSILMAFARLADPDNKNASVFWLSGLAASAFMGMLVSLPIRWLSKGGGSAGNDGAAESQEIRF